MNALIDQLRSLPTMVQSTAQLNSTAMKKPYPFSFLPGGFPTAGLVELSGALGAGKTEVVLRFLNENKTLRVVWLEKEFTFNPAVLSEHQIDPESILFLDLSSPQLKQSPFWCAAQVLKSGLFQVVVLSQLGWGEKDLRRLQLLSKDSGALVFLLEREARNSTGWSFSVQIQVKRSEKSSVPALHVLKNRIFQSWVRPEASSV